MVTMIMSSPSKDWYGTPAKQAPAFKRKICKYNGHTFMSSLEAKVARALDELGIKWKYERYSFLGREYMGGQYTPDFYLPDEHYFIEAVGRIDARHRHNAEQLIKSEKLSSLYIGDDGIGVSDANPGFVFVTNGKERGGWMFDMNGNEVLLLHCMKCNRWSFVASAGGWTCAHCGQYIGEGGIAGDNHGSNIIDASNNAPNFYVSGDAW